MKCYSCEVNMEFTRSVSFDKARVDFFRCAECGSAAEVKYAPNNKVIKVCWVSDGRQKPF